MSNSSQPIACDVYPIKNGWKILRGGVRIGLASSLGTALFKISKLSTNSGIPYRIRIFKKDGSVDMETDSFPPDGFSEAVESPQVSDGFKTSADVSLQEKIALLAYSYWEKRGGQGGSPEEDWYRAEREILEQSLTHIGGAPSDAWK